MKSYFVNENGDILNMVDIEVSQSPLEGIALVATLNAVIGIWSLPDAANIAGLTEQDLINEALAWGVAQENNEV